jgi:AcrR family transcriptional regulator
VTAASERDRLRALIADYCVEHGVADLTLRKVGEAVGSNNRMLLYYFDSKEELIVAGLEEAMARIPQVEGVFEALGDRERPLSNRLVEAWQSIAAEPNLPYLRLFFEVFGLAAQHPARFGRFLDTVGREWSERLADVFRVEGVADADAQPLARQLVAVWRGLQFDLIATGDRPNIDNANVVAAALLADRVARLAKVAR